MFFLLLLVLSDHKYVQQYDNVGSFYNNNHNLYSPFLRIGEKTKFVIMLRGVDDHTTVFNFALG